MTPRPSQKWKNPPALLKGALALAFVLFFFFADYRGDIVSLFHPGQIQILLNKSGLWAPFLYMVIMAWR